MVRGQIINEFERVAVEKGLIKWPESKVTPKIEASEDLHLNLIRLADQLKNQGLVAEAKELEDQFYAFKTAETHLYKAFNENMQDLLNFSHPEGNVEVSSAQDELGQVETTDEIQRKLLESIQHAPTGKYASLLTSTGLVLGLLKTAQVSPEKKNESVAKEGLSDEERLADLKMKDPKKYEKTVQLNQFLDKNWPVVIGSISQAITTSGFDAKGILTYKFTPANLDKGYGLDYYAAKSGLDRDRIKKYLDTKFYLIGKGGFVGKDADTVINTIIKDVYSLYKTTGALQKKYGGIPGTSEYLKGAQYRLGPRSLRSLSNEMLLKAGYNHNPNAMIIGTVELTATSIVGENEIKSVTYSVDNAKADAFAQTILNWFTSEFNTLFGAEVLDKANAGASKDLLPVFQTLHTISSQVTQAAGLRIGNSSAKVLGAMTQAQNSINAVLEGKTLPNYHDPYIAIALFNVVQAIEGWLSSASKQLIGMIDFLTKNPVSKDLESTIDKVSAAGIADTYRNIYLWADLYLRDPSTKSREQMAWAKSIRNIAASVAGLTEGENAQKNFGSLIESLPAELKDLRSPEELLQAGQQQLKELQSIKNFGKDIMTIRQEQVAESAQEYDLIKIAAFPSFPGKVPTGKPGGGQAPSGGAVVGAKFNAQASDQVAVANMQLALNNLGRLISVEANKNKFPGVAYDHSDGLKIIGTGPKSNPHINMFDGKWGANTDAALNLAQKYVASLGGNLKTGVKWNVATKSHAEDTVTAANENASLLNKVNAYVGGEQGAAALKAGSVYDTLPINIDWNLATGPAAASFEGGKVKVTSKDMSSLQALFNFVTKNNMKAVETSGATETDIGVKGWTPPSWNNVIQWFVRRSVLVYNALSKMGQQNADTAREYFEATKQLLSDYTRMISNFGKKMNLSSDQVIRPDLIAMFSRGADTKEGPAGAGSPYGLKRKTPVDKLREQLEGDVEPGKHGKSSGLGNDLPFTNTVDLRDELWADPTFENYVTKLNSPLLKLDNFLRVHGTRMAQQLFSGSTSRMEAQRQAIRTLGKNPIKWNPDMDVWMVKDGETLVPATRFFSAADIDEALRQVMASAPINTYRKFLNDLSSKIHNVMQSWSAEASKDDISRLDDYYKEWQRGIAKQYRDLAG